MKQARIIPLFKFQNGSLSFKVQTIKDFSEEQDESIEVAHSHDYHEIIWLTSGQGTLHADLKEYVIDNNTMFYVRPNDTHRFQIQPGMEGFVFSFTDSFFSAGQYDFDIAYQNDLCRIFAKQRAISIGNEFEADIKETALKMMKEIANNYSNKMELVKRYFKILLMYLSRTSQENAALAEQTRETELVKHFMESLDKNYKEKKMVAEYASELLVTPNYLNRIVKKITGFSAGYQIRQRIVLEAKRMGRYTEAGMKEIAYDLGFLDSAHFSRFFKTFGGLNFSDFKRGALVIPIEATLNRA